MDSVNQCNSQKSMDTINRQFANIKGYDRPKFPHLTSSPRMFN